MNNTVESYPVFFAIGKPVMELSTVVIPFFEACNFCRLIIFSGFVFEDQYNSFSLGFPAKQS